MTSLLKGITALFISSLVYGAIELTEVNNGWGKSNYLLVCANTKACYISMAMYASSG